MAAPQSNYELRKRIRIRTLTASVVSTILLASLGANAPAAEAPPSGASPSPRRDAPSQAKREQALTLLAKGRAAGKAIENAERRVETLRRLAQVQAAAGDKNTARETLGDAKRAAEEMRGPGRGSKGGGLCLVVYSEVDVGDLKSARETADAIGDAELYNEAIRRIGIAQAEAGDLEAALNTAGAIREPERFAWSKAAVISAVAVVQARRDVEQAWVTTKTIEDRKARVYALRELVIALAKGGDLEGAVATVAGIQPSWREEHGEAMRAIIKAYAEAGDFAAAHAKVGEIQDRREKQLALSEIAQVHAGKGHLAAAQEVNDQLEEYYRDDVLVAIGRAQARAGDTAAALESKDKIRSDSAKEKLLGAIITALIEKGDLAQARALAEKAMGRVKVDAFCQLALAQARTDRDAAWESISAARAASSDWHRGTETLVAQTHAKMGNFPNAEATANLIEHPEVRAGAFSDIAVELARAKGFDEAAAWVEKREEPYARCVCFTWLAKELLKPAA